MPISSYYKGHGEEVMDNMVKQYGAEKGKRVFYATAAKRGAKPMQVGGTVIPSYDTSMQVDSTEEELRRKREQALAEAEAAGPQGWRPESPEIPSWGSPVGDWGAPQESMDAGPPGYRSLTAKPSPQDDVASISPAPEPKSSVTEASVSEGPGPEQGQGPSPYHEPPTRETSNVPSPGYTRALAGYKAEVEKKIPLWRQIVGTGLGGTSIGQALLAKPGERRAGKILEAEEKYSEEARKQQQAASTERLTQQRIGTSEEEKKSMAETRLMTVEARKQNADTYKMRVAEMQSERNRRFVQDRLKGREMDSSYQKDTDQRPQGYEFIPDPEKLGFGWAAPPAWHQAPAELASYLAVKPGEMISHSELIKARDAMNKASLEEGKAGGKLDANTRTALASFGGDPSDPADVTKAMGIVQSNALKQVKAKGALKPPKETTVMVPDESGGYRVASVQPGDVIPAGGVTAGGMSSMNVPTAATRTMAERAPRVLEFVSRINQLLDENEKQLGPLRSRWDEFTAGRVGLPNKGYTQLRTDMGLLTTALMNMHVGARGSEKIMEHFHGLIDSSKQDPDNLRAALGEIKAYADRVRTEGRSGSGQSGASPAKVKVWNPQTNTFE
jgi:hypothetical protein